VIAMSDEYINALKVEREGCVKSGKAARIAAIDAELTRLGVGRMPVVELAAISPDAAEAAVVKRGPGRPRKVD
jgi:hypothetical protein